MTKKEKYKKLKNKMPKDYVGKSGIIICRNGATVLVNEDTIREEELDRLLGIK